MPVRGREKKSKEEHKEALQMQKIVNRPRKLIPDFTDDDESSLDKIAIPS